MSAHNPIINAHRRNLRELRKERNMDMEILYVKPTQPLSLEEYCPIKRPLNAQELILEAVQFEDRINHSGKVKEIIPKMHYPELKLTPTSIVAFARGIFKGCLP